MFFNHFPTMDKIIQKNINCYFGSLENHVKKWNDIVENLQRPLVGLKNQAEQLAHVERVEVDNELVQFPDLKDKLLFKILSGIDSELLIFKNAMIQLSSLNQDLRNKLIAFDKSTSDFDWYNDDENSGSAFQPHLSNLLQMALESWKYYSEIYQCITGSFKTLDIRNNTSLQKFSDSLKMDCDIQDRIKYILAITQYCNKNT